MWARPHRPRMRRTLRGAAHCGQHRSAVPRACSPPLDKRAGPSAVTAAVIPGARCDVGGSRGLLYQRVAGHGRGRFGRPSPALLPLGGLRPACFASAYQQAASDDRHGQQTGRPHPRRATPRRNRKHPRRRRLSAATSCQAHPPARYAKRQPPDNDRPAARLAQAG